MSTVLCCPQCGHEQAEGFPECVRCGVFFDKYERHQQTEEEPQQPSVAEIPVAGHLEQARMLAVLCGRVLPAVRSACVSSGSVSLLAILVLATLTPVGAAMAATGGALIWLVGGIATKIIVALGSVVLAVMFALLVFVTRYLVVGWLAALAVTQLGQFGKNRSQGVAFVYGAGCGALAAYLLMMAGPRVLPDPGLDAPESPGYDMIERTDAFTSVLAYWRGNGPHWETVNFFGLFLSALLAGTVAGRNVGLKKYCERCSRFMTAVELGRSSFERAQLARPALQRRDLVAWKSAANHGGWGPCQSTLFVCRRCGEGYLESKAHYSWSSKVEGSHDSVNAEWLFASMKITRREVALVNFPLR